MNNEMLHKLEQAGLSSSLMMRLAFHAEKQAESAPTSELRQDFLRERDQAFRIADILATSIIQETNA